MFCSLYILPFICPLESNQYNRGGLHRDVRGLKRFPDGELMILPRVISTTQTTSDASLNFGCTLPHLHLNLWCVLTDNPLPSYSVLAFHNWYNWDENEWNNCPLLYNKSWNGKCLVGTSRTGECTTVLQSLFMEHYCLKKSNW